jgi:hypothetical protein
MLNVCASPPRTEHLAFLLLLSPQKELAFNGDYCWEDAGNLGPQFSTYTKLMSY